MLFIHPSILVCGLVQLLAINQTTPPSEILLYARLSTLVTFTTRIAEYAQAHFNQETALQLYTGAEPYPLPLVEINTPTDLILYTAPIGAYAWHSNPLLRKAVYRGAYKIHTTIVRARNTASVLLRSRPLFPPRRSYLASYIASSNPDVLNSPPSYSIVVEPLSSLHSSAHLHITNSSSVNLPTLPNFGPEIDDLRRFLRHSDVSIASGLDFCGLGTRALSNRVSASVLRSITSTPAVLGQCELGARPTVLDTPTLLHNTSTLSGLGWCGRGTESIAGASFEISRLHLALHVCLISVGACVLVLAFGFVRLYWADSASSLGPGVLQAGHSLGVVPRTLCRTHSRLDIARDRQRFQTCAQSARERVEYLRSIFKAKLFNTGRYGHIIYLAIILKREDSPPNAPDVPTPPSEEREIDIREKEVWGFEKHSVPGPPAAEGPSSGGDRLLCCVLCYVGELKGLGWDGYERTVTRGLINSGSRFVDVCWV
ncbi:hypothetical protein BDV93DRAFT_503170 [Ceratobasidium sp. AG-I]|nr:hypothetical protein BDV93DRAFT_503170 [Ceratobasidium sp. AG-I]